MCLEEARMYHPITIELLVKSQEYDRSKQRQACQLYKSFRASRPSRPSRIQKGMDLLRILLVHAGKHLGEAKIAFWALVWERASTGDKARW